jgi:hypothetical protein
VSANRLNMGNYLRADTYFPYNAKLCFNGNHWAQRQAAKVGLGFTPLDNAFAADEDPAKLQKICDRLGEKQIEALLRKWLAGCRIRSAARTGPPGTAATSRSCRPSSA